MNTPDFSAALERAIAAANRATPDLLLRPEVVSVGAGMERRRGKPTGLPAIIVTVHRKLGRAALRQHGLAPLPDAIDGVPVDVVQAGAPVEDDRTRRAFERAVRAKASRSARLLQQPGVTGVGVGYRLRGGQTTGEVVIQVFVQRKVAPADLQRLGLVPVPATLGGVPTDVVQAGPFRETVAPSGSRADRKDPLIGGLSLGHASAPFHYGTLAAVVFDSGNQAMALSNEHVLDGDIGETVHQPSPVGLDDSFEIDFQLDVCNPLNFVRIDTPDTLGGSILAGAAVAAAVAAALSDEIDPTREGQAATVPAPGARTLEEATHVQIKYPRWPLPGQPFALHADWQYERRTDQGTLRHAASPDRRNPHVLLYHRLFVDRSRYSTADRIRLFGLVVPPDLPGQDGKPGGRPRPCSAYHCVALLHPLKLDRSDPVVLRNVRERDDRDQILERFLRLLRTHEGIDGRERELIERHKDRWCLYYAEVATAGLPLGPWRHWMHVQTVNTVPPGTDPLVAAQTIGGLPVSDHYRQTLDVACGPFVFDDDGSFDIELLSI